MNKKGQEAAESETVYNEAIKGTLEKTEALEKQVKKRLHCGRSLWRPQKQTSSNHFWSARRRRSGISMNSLTSHAGLAPHTKHMHPLERTKSTRFGLSQHGKRVRRVVV